MKTLYTLLIALLLTNTVHAQIKIKNTWAKALLSFPTDANALSTDTIYKSITVFQADTLIKNNDTNPDFMIIDVRSHNSFISGHIPDAVNIDFFDSSFYVKINNLDKNKTFLIYCTSGITSKLAFDTMKSLQFRELYNMIGGFKKWKTEGFDYEIDSATSIVEFQGRAADFSIYPNPANNQLNIELYKIPDAESMSVYNLSGQELLKQTITAQKSEINISALPAGIYMLKLSGKTSLFIKQ